MSDSKQPLIVIVGPTASGKTGLAIRLAQKYDGEVVCADSRTIYKGMDIGTAKPNLAEQRGVPHWGLDLINPGDYYSVADFKQYALQKIDEIRSRGHIPFLVGGTGLYIDSIIFDYQFGDSADAVRREELNNMSIQQLYEYCHSNNIILPENFKNKRYVIRKIEQNGQSVSNRDSMIDNVIVVGIITNKDELMSRIRQRIRQIIDSGVVDEASRIAKQYGWDSEAMKGNVYRLVGEYQKSQLSIEDIERKLAILDWRLTKRQMTWFRRNKNIIWLNLIEAEKYLDKKLANNR
ncbi:tRNA (adenosine(37)-N6)-dimethylallyltransferase MiaA [Candidatus Saccharibacteria bacterium]|nr:tRNA (adenosine(37)-N6)-dimethylallyltransferase MiaA [Candidatus Saccharibacteria bacterium]